jgi:acetyltransferase-like isoleucine patch superfamily enzyme
MGGPSQPLPETMSEPLALSAIAARYSLELHGPDREITAFGGVTTRLLHRSTLLTWATSSDYVEAFLASDIAACVVSRKMQADMSEAGERSLLVTAGDPADAFYTIFSDAALAGAWSRLQSNRGPSNQIAPSAQIHDHVVIGSDCQIMDNVVVLPQTYIGDRVVVMPNTTIGGQGFQYGPIRGRQRLIPHAGGVYIADDATIGSNVCIDCGLFGEWTSIEKGARLDNLLHIAHSATIGEEAAIVACAEISGSVIIGDRAWVGPNSSVIQGRRVGDHALIGIGSVIVRDIPAHAVAYGVPAQVRGWRCVCGARLDLDNPELTCGECSHRFRVRSGQPILL